jgi:hypothetical protein
MLRTLVQFEKWDAILDGQSLPVLARPRQEAWRHWARALAYANQRNPAAAIEESRHFDQALADFRTRAKRPDPPELLVARQELAAHLEFAGGNPARALKLFEAASKAECRLTYTEPPYYPRPVAEVTGRVATGLNKPRQAARAFGIALRQYPGDTHAKPSQIHAVSTAAAAQ